MSFYDWLVHLPKCLYSSSMLQHTEEFPFFLRLNNTLLYVQVMFCFSSPINERLSQFHVLDIVNAAMNMGVQIFCFKILLSILLSTYYQKWNCWIIIFCFKFFMRKWQTVFHSICIILQSISSAQGFQCLHILTKHLLFSHFLTVVILMVVGWYPTVVLIFISIICDLVNHFMCLLATCISSLQKCLFKFFAHF